MYAESDYDSFSEYSTAEIQRVPLDSLMLQITALNLGNVRKFPFLEPPSMANIETAIHFLKEQGALHSNETLTPVGQMLAKLPVDIVVGKMLIMGTVFHVIEPVLAIAAALSVQSPFSRVMLGQSDISAARRPLESEHGDPFMLLNAFDEWIQMKSEGSNAAYRWCKRRGLEQQRFYEITKLREQFQEILQDHELLPRGFLDSGGGGRQRRERLTEDQRKELRQMRKRQRAEHRKRKILKLDEEGGAQSDSEEESVTSDLKDLEFKLLHDLSQLQEASNVRRSFTLRDVNVLKIVLCSGLYPQLAVADDCNSYRRDSEQVFHTKSKSFVLLHPTSVFATNPEYLQPQGKEADKKNGCEMLAYVDLLETNKPYLTNVMRVPALQTITLFSPSLDTNSDCTRLVVDEWLELKFPSPETGQDVLSAVQTLRSMWSHLLEMKLQASQSRHDPYDSRSDDAAKISYLEESLASKLAEFLDSSFPYTLHLIPSAMKNQLYKGPSAKDDGSKKSSAPSMVDKGKDLKIHPTKGGKCITEYLTYDCLLEGAEAAALQAQSTSSQYIQRVWTCPSCQQKMALTLAEQLQHQAECRKHLDEMQAAADSSRASEQAGPSSRALLLKEYHCKDCDEVLQLTTIDILKHKRMHAKQKQQQLS